MPFSSHCGLLVLHGRVSAAIAHDSGLRLLDLLLKLRNHRKAGVVGKILAEGVRRLTVAYDAAFAKYQELQAAAPLLDG